MKLRAQNIIKRYGSRTVVKGVSFEVNQGEIVGLLGPNGAGKTTSFYMVVGLIKPNEGQVFIDDLDLKLKASWRISRFVLTKWVQSLLKLGSRQTYSRTVCIVHMSGPPSFPMT